MCALALSPPLRAQEEIPVLDECVGVTGSVGNWSVVNNCGLPIHAWWGFWDKSTDTGTMSYSADLNPGQSIALSSVFGNAGIYALGCSSVAQPGYAYGRKLTYADPKFLGKTVSNWTHVNSLTCMQWR